MTAAVIYTIATHGNLQAQSAIVTASNGTLTATIPYGVTTFVGTAH